MSEHPSHVVACLDFKNDFGTIERTTCMEVLRGLCPNPAWLDVANIMLSHPTLVVNPNRHHAAITYDGLPQGTHLAHSYFPSP